MALVGDLEGALRDGDVDGDTGGGRVRQVGHDLHGEDVADAGGDGLARPGAVDGEAQGLGCGGGCGQQAADEHGWERGSQHGIITSL